MSICSLNGQFLDLKEAKISPLDRGFLFGDAIYEVIASYNNKPFKIEEHLDRLFIKYKNITQPFSSRDEKSYSVSNRKK
jgi:D-alanine transaminase